MKWYYAYNKAWLDGNNYVKMNIYELLNNTAFCKSG